MHIKNNHHNKLLKYVAIGLTEEKKGKDREEKRKQLK